MPTLDEQIREATLHLAELQIQRDNQREQEWVEKILPLIDGLEFAAGIYAVNGQLRLELMSKGTPLNRLLEEYRFNQVDMDGMLLGTEIRIYSAMDFYDHLILYGPIEQIVKLVKDHKLKLDLSEVYERIEETQTALNAFQKALSQLEQEKD